MSTGTLYVVATPIGNLEDSSARSIRILADVARIAAEDTRHTQKLLNHFEITTPLLSYHAHNEAARAQELIGYLQGGESIALVSDAGTPCVSDPGHYLVDAAHNAGIPVQVVPGPCAAVAAYALTGFDTDRFVFHGFMPRKRGEVSDVISDARAYPAAHIYYESPKRIAKSLGWIREIAPELPMAIARELTKVHETILRGTATSLAEQLSDGVRGECVLILDTQSGADVTREIDDAAIDECLRDKIDKQGLSQRDAIREVAEELGLPRNRVYSIAVEKS